MNRRSNLSPARQAASSAIPAGSSAPARRLASRLALLVLCALGALGPTQMRAESANSMFKHGEAAEAKGDYDTAFDLYQKALNKAPNDLTYKTALYRVRVTASSVHMVKGRKLLEGGDDQGALVEFLHAQEIDPGNEAAQQEIAKLRRKSGELPAHTETSLPEQAGTEEQLDAMGGPVQLKPISNDPLTMQYTEDAKVIYQAIGKAAGINVLFDPDYTSKRITVSLTNESLMDALRIVGVMSNTFWRPVTDNTIFVAQNTRQKHTDLEETAVQTFYLTNAWQQNDLTDVATAVRNILTGIKIYNVPSQNAIVIRGTPDELLLAQKLINDLDKARSEVVVDIAVLEVSKNWERTLGIAWPSSVGLALQAPDSTNSSTSTTTTTTSTSTSPSLYDLAHLKATDFAVTIGSATANLLLTDSNTKILQNPRIRATDAQKATMKIGERIPIATGSYQTGAATAVVSSLVNTQFQYQDVGVNIEMTPTVHYDHDVTLKVKIEVTSQSGSVTISGVTEPILSQRVVDQVIRLREGEASILGGIQNKQDAVSWTGIPGLSSIPILKYLFGSKDRTVSDDELVFLVVPHIVRTQQLDQANLRTIDTGAGTTVELRHVAAPSVAPAPARPVTESHPSMGVVPGQSAAAAAPAAMLQMSASADVNGQTAAGAVSSPSASAAASVMPAAVPTGPAMPSPAVSSSGMPTPPPPPPPTVALPLPAPVSTTQGNAPALQPLNLMFSLPGAIAAGGTFNVPVVLTGGRDVDSVPMEIQYDPARLALVNVTSGDLLTRDNQAVGLVHRDDGPGNITINAARPPGVAGISGAGVVCLLTFQAKAAGETSIALTSGAAVNSAQQRSPAPPTRATVVIH